MILGAIIVLACNLITIGCMHFSYAKAGKLENNMVLGVTLSQEQFLDEGIQEVVRKFRSVFHKTVIIGYVTAVLVTVPIFWYASVWLVVFMIWMFGYIAMMMGIYVKYHRKLYELKVKKGFTYGSKTYEVAIDTRLSQLKNKMIISEWWFLITLLPVIFPLVFEKFRKHMLEDMETSIMMYSIIFFVKLCYYFMYYLFAKKKSQVYSKNSENNIVCNRIVKRGYSILFLVLSIIDSFSFLLLLWDEMSMGYMTNVSFICFLILQTGIITGLLCGMYTVKKKTTKILEQDKERYIVDEDEFWKSGFYYNPKDNHLFVKDRQNGMNMTMNMAKKSSWIFYIITLGGTLVLVVWISVVLLRLDFVETRYEINDNLFINAPSYAKTIEFDEIKSIRLIEELPDVRMSKQNGAATDEYSLGKFRVRNQGVCYLYIYHEYSPIIELETEDMKIYFNSKQEGVIEECYEELLEKCKGN